jgi:hypothetical protein
MYGMGETATVYAARAAQFALDMAWVGQLFTDHPHLRGIEATIKPGHIDITTVGFNGVLRDWDHALPPVIVRDTGFFQLQSGLGIEDILKTGNCTLHCRRPDGNGGRL